MSNALETKVARALIQASIDGVREITDFAHVAVRAMLAPDNMQLVGAVPKHLAVVEEAFGIVDCEKCHRHPTVTYSHDKGCAADTRARQRTDTHAEPPVQIL